MGLGRGILSHYSIFDSHMAFFCHCNKSDRHVRFPDCDGSYGSHDDSSDTQYCRCNQHDSKHRNYFALCQLRGNLSFISSYGNGTCTKCVQSDTMIIKGKKVMDCESTECVAIREYHGSIEEATLRMARLN